MFNAHTPIEVFCSYAPEDESSFQQLQKHLRVLTRQERIVLWHYRQITPGSDWAQVIDTQVYHPFAHQPGFHGLGLLLRG